MADGYLVSLLFKDKSIVVADSGNFWPPIDYIEPTGTRNGYLSYDDGISAARVNYSSSAINGASSIQQPSYTQEALAPTPSAIPTSSSYRCYMNDSVLVDGSQPSELSDKLQSFLQQLPPDLSQCHHGHRPFQDLDNLNQCMSCNRLSSSSPRQPQSPTSSRFSGSSSCMPPPIHSPIETDLSVQNAPAAEFGIPATPSALGLSVSRPHCHSKSNTINIETTATTAENCNFSKTSGDGSPTNIMSNYYSVASVSVARTVTDHSCALETLDDMDVDNIPTPLQEDYDLHSNTRHLVFDPEEEMKDLSSISDTPFLFRNPTVNPIKQSVPPESAKTLSSDARHFSQSRCVPRSLAVAAVAVPVKLCRRLRATIPTPASLISSSNRPPDPQSAHPLPPPLPSNVVNGCCVSTDESPRSSMSQNSSRQEPPPGPPEMYFRKSVAFSGIPCIQGLNVRHSSQHPRRPTQSAVGGGGDTPVKWTFGSRLRRHKQPAAGTAPIAVPTGPLCWLNIVGWGGCDGAGKTWGFLESNLTVPGPAPTGSVKSSLGTNGPDGTGSSGYLRISPRIVQQQCRTMSSNQTTSQRSESIGSGIVLGTGDPDLDRVVSARMIRQYIKLGRSIRRVARAIGNLIQEESFTSHLGLGASSFLNNDDKDTSTRSTTDSSSEDHCSSSLHLKLSSPIESDRIVWAVRALSPSTLISDNHQSSSPPPLIKQSSVPIFLEQPSATPVSCLTATFMEVLIFVQSILKLQLRQKELRVFVRAELLRKTRRDTSSSLMNSTSVNIPDGPLSSSKTTSDDQQQMLSAAYWIVFVAFWIERRLHVVAKEVGDPSLIANFCCCRLFTSSDARAYRNAAATAHTTPAPRSNRCCEGATRSFVGAASPNSIPGVSTPAPGLSPCLYSVDSRMSLSGTSSVYEPSSVQPGCSSISTCSAMHHVDSNSVERTSDKLLNGLLDKHNSGVLLDKHLGPDSLHKQGTRSEQQQQQQQRARSQVTTSCVCQGGSYVPLSAEKSAEFRRLETIDLSREGEDMLKNWGAQIDSIRRFLVLIFCAWSWVEDETVTSSSIVAILQHVWWCTNAQITFGLSDTTRLCKTNSVSVRHPPEQKAPAPLARFAVQRLREVVAARSKGRLFGQYFGNQQFPQNMGKTNKQGNETEQAVAQPVDYYAEFLALPTSCSTADFEVQVFCLMRALGYKLALLPENVSLLSTKWRKSLEQEDCCVRYSGSKFGCPDSELPARP